MTDFLFDTNALSEPARKAPDGGYMEWFGSADESHFFTSCLVLGEIRKGINLSTNEARQRQFELWLAEIIDAFNGRVLRIDTAVSQLWGQLMAQGQRQGRTPPAIDTLIAAQCMHHNMTLVTRNKKDFEQFAELAIHSPWTK